MSTDPKEIAERIDLVRQFNEWSPAETPTTGEVDAGQFAAGSVRFSEAAHPMIAALLRIVYQSFDSGGESGRSMRAQALETALFLVHRVDDPEFWAAIRECDDDRWAFITKARLAAFSGDPLPHPPSDQVGG